MRPLYETETVELDLAKLEPYDDFFRRLRSLPTALARYRRTEPGGAAS